MIGLVELYGLMVSATHILTSGMAATTVANGFELQMSGAPHGARQVTTLAAALLIAGTLFLILRYVF